jgi:hypothetical protein
MKVLNPAHYRICDSARSGMAECNHITRDNVECLLGARVIEAALNNGRWWKIRRNGATKTWKRDEEKVRIPIKFGYKGYGVITEKDFIDA